MRRDHGSRPWARPDPTSAAGAPALSTESLWVLAVLLGVHGLVVFGADRLLRLDRAPCAVVSQATLGGGTTALVLARSLGRPDLVPPGLLVGSLGTASGTVPRPALVEWMAP